MLFPTHPLFSPHSPPSPPPSVLILIPKMYLPEVDKNQDLLGWLPLTHSHYFSFYIPPLPNEPNHTPLLHQPHAIHRSPLPLYGLSKDFVLLRGHLPFLQHLSQCLAQGKDSINICCINKMGKCFYICSKSCLYFEKNQFILV